MKTKPKPTMVTCACCSSEKEMPAHLCDYTLCVTYKPGHFDNQGNVIRKWEWVPMCFDCKRTQNQTYIY